MSPIHTTAHLTVLQLPVIRRGLVFDHVEEHPGDIGAAKTAGGLDIVGTRRADFCPPVSLGRVDQGRAIQHPVFQDFQKVGHIAQANLAAVRRWRFLFLADRTSPPLLSANLFAEFLDEVLAKRDAVGDAVVPDSGDQLVPTLTFDRCSRGLLDISPSFLGNDIPTQ